MSPKLIGWVGGVRCLGLFPKKSRFFFYPFPNCNVESVNENVGKNDESDDDTVTRKVFSPHNLGTPGSPGVKGPSS